MALHHCICTYCHMQKATAEERRSHEDHTVSYTRVDDDWEHCTFAFAHVTALQKQQLRNVDCIKSLQQHVKQDPVQANGLQEICLQGDAASAVSQTQGKALRQRKC